MKSITTDRFARALRHVCDCIVDAEPQLTELDNLVGDGDHGLGMKDGFGELRRVLCAAHFSDCYELTRTAGMVLVKSMGGASGVIFGTLFLGGCEATVDDDGTHRVTMDADALRLYFRRSAEAIARRGRARANDRTMLDALLHAVAAMEDSATDDISELLHCAYEGALRGVEATKQMRPRIGRSKNFREQAIGWPDPGAVSTSIIFRGLWEAIENLRKEDNNYGTC